MKSWLFRWYGTDHHGRNNASPRCQGRVCNESDCWPDTYWRQPLPHVTLPGSLARPARHLLARGLCRGEAADTMRSRVARAEGRGRAAGRGLAIQQARAVAFRAFDESRPRGGVLHGLDNLFRRVSLHIIDGGERAAEAMTDGASRSRQW